MENLPQRLRQKRNPLRFIVKGRGQELFNKPALPKELQEQLKENIKRHADAIKERGASI